MTETRLEVFANGARVGELSRRDDGYFRFDRASDMDPDFALGLAPETQKASFVGPRPRILPSVFAQVLPEGQLYEFLERRFGEILKGKDQLSLLGVVGRSTVGRLRFAFEGEPMDEPPRVDLLHFLEEATSGVDSHLDYLMEQFSRFNGVSGVQPKTLVADKQTTTSIPTIIGTTHIVKGFDPELYPDLVLNELFCLRVAARAGLPVAEAQACGPSNSFLAVRRFDLCDDGTYLGFDDMCAIAEMASERKYNGSYEKVAKLVAVYSCEPSEDLMRLFGSLVLSVLVRNGDAHRKNFGMTFTSRDDARLAPVYDVVSTSVYPQLDDRMALMLGGKHTWPTRRALERFGRDQCGLSPKKAATVIEAVADALEAEILDLDNYGFSEVMAEQMIATVRQGLASMKGRCVSAAL